VCRRLTGRMSEPQTCTTGCCGMARCTGACPVSGWITGFSLLECGAMLNSEEMARSRMPTRHQLTAWLGDIEFWCAERAKDGDITEEFSGQLRKTAKGLRGLIADLRIVARVPYPSVPAAGVEVPNDAGF